MRFIRKGAVVLAVTAASALALSACAGNSKGGGTKSSAPSGGSSAPVPSTAVPTGAPKGGTLIYGSEQYPDNWNPAINAGNAVSTGWAEVQILPSPYIVNPRFDIIPDKNFNAEEPQITSQNPFTITYKINPKAVWSDGQPITSDDFKFQWQTENPTDPLYGTKGGGCASIASNMDKIKSISGSDNNKTVTVVYKAPFPDWKLQLTGLLPAHLLKKATPKATCAAFNAGWPATSPLAFSGGPWMMKTVNKTQQTFTETPNPKYWGPKPNLSQLIYKTIGSDAQTLQQDLQNQEVQLIYPQPQLDLIRLISQLPDVQAQTSFGLSFEHIDFNVTNKFLKDVNLRRAIGMAIDRQGLVKATVGQFDSRAKVDNNRIFVNNQPGYKDNAPKQYDKADPAAAKKLLQQHGYTYSGSNLMAPNGLGHVALKIVTTSGNPLRAETETLVKAQLATIGIAVTTVQRDASIWFGDNTQQGSLNAGDFDMGLYAWVASPLLTGNQSIYACVPNNNRALGAQNSGLGCDKTVDRTIAKAVVTVPPDQQIALWNQIDTQLWNDMFTLPLYQKPTFIAYSKKYGNIADNASSTGPLWNSQLWYRKK